jgi:formylglycine-generating enzyme required for sulfatase activity
MRSDARVCVCVCAHKHTHTRRSQAEGRPRQSSARFWLQAAPVETAEWAVVLAAGGLARACTPDKRHWCNRRLCGWSVARRP